MKKNISINISGIIFHIEEDGYDDLKSYLDSINHYFSSFDDNHEIVADIESRIAEIFLARLKDGKEVITNEDVRALKATMGSIKDFKAIDEDTSYILSDEEKSEANEDDTTKEASNGEPQTKRLYRDIKRKILGGVLAGLANYLGIDPSWVRIFFMLVFLGVFFIEALGPGLLLAYVILWMVMPPAYDLKLPEKSKRMFRNPDDKVLGGVCSGLAAYLGVDTVLIRLLFVISILFGGTGLIVYIILWIILPVAVTITDKMQMKGQPITLSNIESNIKKSFQVKEGEEQVWVKMLMFPFRIIAQLIEFLNKIAGPFFRFVVDAARIFLGAVLLLTGFSLFVSVMASGAIMTGLVTAPELLYWYEFPLAIIQNDITWYTGLAIIIGLVIPAIFIAILGAIVIARQNILNKAVAYSLLGLWILSLGVVLVTVPPIITDFSTSGEYVEEKVFETGEEVLSLQLRQAGYFDYDEVKLDIKSHDDENVKLLEEFHARGFNRLRAVENAQMISYGVEKKDSVIYFDSHVSFREDAKFRVQELYMTLYIPEGQHFVVDYDLNQLLGNFMRRKGYERADVQNNTWYFENGELICATCPSTEEDKPPLDFEESKHGVTREFEFTDFDEVKISERFKVNIRQGNGYLIAVNGDREALDKVVFEKRGEGLYIKSSGNLSGRDNLTINIEMPHLDHLNVDGSSEVLIAGFVEDYLSMDIEKASEVSMDVVTKKLSVKITGASKLELSGITDVMEVDIKDAAKLQSFGFKASEVMVKASGSSSARINASDYIQVEAKDASHVRYRGEATVEIDKSPSSRVIAD